MPVVVLREEDAGYGMLLPFRDNSTERFMQIENARRLAGTLAVARLDEDRRHDCEAVFCEDGARRLVAGRHVGSFAV